MGVKATSVFVKRAGLQKGGMVNECGKLMNVEEKREMNVK
jgi:hypothetical protein